jgi:hypothetical protein
MAFLFHKRHTRHEWTLVTREAPSVWAASSDLRRQDHRVSQQSHAQQHLTKNTITMDYSTLLSAAQDRRVANLARCRNTGNGGGENHWSVVRSLCLRGEPETGVLPGFALASFGGLWHTNASLLSWAFLVKMCRSGWLRLQAVTINKRL